MNNLINPRNPDTLNQSFDPNVDNSIKRPHVGILGKILWYLSFLLIIPIFLHIAYRNGFFSTQTRINETASTIDTQLKQRRDTLVKLLDATKNYINYEKSLLTEITQLRNLNINPNNTPAANAQINNVFGRLLAVAENYPDLKSSQNVQQLMQTAYYLEQEVAAARRLYNSEVRIFNEGLFVWPKSVIADSLNLSSMPYFEASTTDKQDVQLKF